MLYSHHHYLIPGYFHHPQKKPLIPQQQLLTSSSSCPLATAPSTFRLYEVAQAGYFIRMEARNMQPPASAPFTWHNLNVPILPPIYAIFGIWHREMLFPRAQTGTLKDEPCMHLNRKNKRKKNKPKYLSTKRYLNNPWSLLSMKYV